MCVWRRGCWLGRLDRARRLVQEQALARLAEAVLDPATREALTPHYALGCKRVLLSGLLADLRPPGSRW
jgi:cation diffusion facilitator CzcD-associated flavoprotein CzcO